MRLLNFSIFILCFGEAIYLNDQDNLYETYLSYEEIETELDNLVDGTLNPALQDYGYTLTKTPSVTQNGNNMNYMTIKNAGSSDDQWVVVVCGLDGSDWTSVMACMNLLKNPAFYGFPKNDGSSGFLSAVNLMVIPVANPDGYEFSFSNDRLWRKNRGITDKPFCPGVFLDRNFNSNWCENCPDNACAEDYQGSAPFSEAESSLIKNEMERLVAQENGKILSFLTVKKNFENGEVLYSSSLSEELQSEDRQEIFLAEKMANAMSRTSGNILYQSLAKNSNEYGSSMEWAKSTKLANYAYEISLAGVAVLPQSQIRPLSANLMSAVEILWKNSDKRAVFKATALDDYVWKSDANYSWYLMEDYTIEDEYTTTYLINMTSQQWLDNSILDRSVWWHYNVIVVPKVIKEPDAALMLIAGWNNKETNDPTGALTRSDTKRVIAYVSHSGVPAVINYCSPNSPIKFVNDPLEALYPNGRTEDGIIARTWHMFVDDTSKPEVLLRLPMTKGAVRTMDTTEQFLVELGHQKPVRWGVTGASKRGWAAWTVAAVDYERVIFCSPVWLDYLDLLPSSHGHYKSLGGWTYNFYDYYVEGFTMNLDDPNYQLMADIVDPYSYVDRYSRSQTLLIQHAGNDEFFMPSDTYYYWDDLFGEKYMRIYPNKGHGGVGRNDEDGPEIDNIVWQAIDGIFDEVLNPKILNKFVDFEPWTWTLNDFENESNVQFFSNIEPTSIKAWVSYSATSDRQDWRKSGLSEYLCPWDIENPEDIEDKFEELWNLQNVTYYDITDQIVILDDKKYPFSYEISQRNPDSGFITYFLDIEVIEEGGGNLYVTTQSQIAPKAFSFDDCSTPLECLGCFI